MQPRLEDPTAPPTAAVADACLRLGEPVRLAPPGLHPIREGTRLAGPAHPVRHFGSVDVFLEAFEVAAPGDLLVIDNDGRLDEACIGDLTVLEAASAKIAGLLVWGLHRDTQELRRIGLPVFSYGTFPAGPTQARSRSDNPLGTVRFGKVTVTRGDVVVADDDGAVFVTALNAQRVLQTAASIVSSERGQADKVRRGTTLRSQFRFREFLERRREKPDLTFREHLRRLGGEIEQ